MNGENVGLYLEKLAYITQNSQVFMGTILENMLISNIGLVRKIDQMRKRREINRSEEELISKYLLRRVLECLEMGESLNFIDSQKNGLLTTVGDRVCIPYYLNPVPLLFYGLIYTFRSVLSPNPDLGLYKTSLFKPLQNHKNTNSNSLLGLRYEWRTATKTHPC